MYVKIRTKSNTVNQLLFMCEKFVRDSRKHCHCWSQLIHYEVPGQHSTNHHETWQTPAVPWYTHTFSHHQHGL